MSTLFEYKTIYGLKMKDLAVEIDSDGDVVSAEYFDFQKDAWVNVPVEKLGDHWKNKAYEDFLALEPEDRHDEYQDQRRIAGE